MAEQIRFDLGKAGVMQGAESRRSTRWVPLQEAFAEEVGGRLMQGVSIRRVKADARNETGSDGSSETS